MRKSTMSKTLAAAFLLTFLGSGATIANGAQPSPYAGEEKREIKALSSEEVATYLEGKGMGLAKVAEAEILDAEQIHKYDQLRSYAQTGDSSHHGQLHVLPASPQGA
jgi:hypothetical protein